MACFIVVLLGIIGEQMHLSSERSDVFGNLRHVDTSPNSFLADFRLRPKLQKHNFRRLGDASLQVIFGEIPNGGQLKFSTGISPYKTKIQLKDPDHEIRWR